MADLEKQEKAAAAAEGEAAAEEEEERFLEGMAVLDFDMLCSTVALQTQWGWRKLDGGDDENGESGDFGGVLRMWEGELLHCFEDRRIAIESSWLGTIHFILVLSALLNCIAFIVTKRNCFLYLSIAFTLSVGTYLGFFRTQMKKKFNIRGSDNSLDDCIYHLICPCCTLCQESRTLEMNNVQDGIWHGRGDTICIGSVAEGRKAFYELQPPPLVSPMVPDTCSIQITAESNDHSST
ncbi:hypothetical protein L484_004893 [Morus notabilis]|uniref:Uncharacterized protein n=1 Tax=Morus notabilis TaxID=981085 RepID=W9RV55_9ROSA|nr:hypothetical protein L484_004893 [Morus notabilis]